MGYLTHRGLCVNLFGRFQLFSDRFQAILVDLAEKARAISFVAGAAVLFAFDHQGVAVAVGEDFFDEFEVFAGFAFKRQSPARQS